MTIYEKIKELSIEDMADFLAGDNSFYRFDCNECESGELCTDYTLINKCDNKCTEHCIKWLQEEYQSPV